MLCNFLHKAETLQNAQNKQYLNPNSNIVAAMWRFIDI